MKNLKKHLKTKKIFLLSLIVPAVLLLWPFLTFKNGSTNCSRSLSLDTFIECKSFTEYLTKSLFGNIQIEMIIISFIFTLFIVSGVYFFFNKRKKISVFFIILAILLIILTIY